MMQHNKFDGVPVGVYGGDKFEDRMRRIRRESLGAAAKRADDDSPWYTLRVMSGREKAVKNFLDEASIEAMMPMRMGPEIRRRGRILPAKPLPVMTGYLFARCVRSDEAVIGFLGVEHVTGLLGGSLTPHMVSNKDVRRFNEMAEQGDFDWERPTKGFKKGQIVRVRAGAFKSFCGLIVTCNADGTGDAVIEMEMFSGKIPVLIPLANLEKV
jgi:transcriptional antiterminator NusG